MECRKNSTGFMGFLFMIALSLMTTLAQAEPQDIEFVDLEGKNVNLSDFRGQWVIVNIWATWCPPCIKEMPDLTFFHEKYKDDGAIVLGVNYENIAVEKINNFTEELMITFPIVRFKDIDLNANKTPFGPLRGLPSTYMVAPSGHIVAGRAGLVDQELLESFIKEYEAKNPQ
ncbi:TlpA disulfide reductase family protein [Thiomicrospira sp.]|uniref:TlpA disulfide reductase family protein n=1 Tax=Thiomicrospira sp. TaxID=935 RepID=UPI0025F6AA94|nr:TlpA disulfide reductase family protein [Thiomicrospira sp.]